MSNADFLQGAATLRVFLQPGEYFVGDRRHVVRTLLGSCVSITLWHPRARIGAMSHYMLARRAGGAMDAPLNARYGEEALDLMIANLAELGVAARQCEAKIFGGGQMFPVKEEVYSVGQKNGDAARSLLKERGIALVSESISGAGHRRIIFNVNSGDVWSCQVDPSTLAFGANQERAWQTSRS